MEAHSRENGSWEERNPTLGFSIRRPSSTGRQRCHDIPVNGGTQCCPEVHVRQFEEGKAVFWLQSLRLRSTALDELPTADSGRLRHLFQSVDVEHACSFKEGLEKVDLERHIEHRRQLNDDADRLFKEIRLRPRFDRFLKIPQYEQLAQAASNGIVVALVANEPYFFVVIIQAGKDPQHLFLPSLNGNKLHKLIELTSGSGMRDAVERGLAKERVPPRIPLE
jgi:hypothetical protein